MNHDQIALDIVKKWSDGIYQEDKPWTQKQAALQIAIAEMLKFVENAATVDAIRGIHGYD